MGRTLPLFASIPVPADAQLQEIGDDLGQALDAGQLPTTRVARPIPKDAPGPPIAWSPSRPQWIGRNLRRWIKRTFRHGR